MAKRLQKNLLQNTNKLITNKVIIAPKTPTTAYACVSARQTLFAEVYVVFRESVREGFARLYCYYPA